MRNTFKILFYIKRKALLRNGKAPIMGRITINGQCTQFSTQLSVDPAHWDTHNGHVKGWKPLAVAINDQLSNIRYRVESCYNHNFYGDPFVTPQKVKDLFLGTGSRRITLLSFFRKHNREFLNQVGINRHKSTYYKYRCVYIHLESYIHQIHNRVDMPFSKIDKEFLLGFHRFMLDNGMKINTIWIYMTALKHIFALAQEQKLMQDDLFQNYKLHCEFVQREWLSSEEVLALLQLSVPSGTPRLVLDAFLFSCFTGLSYIDLCQLKPGQIINREGKMWISTTRQKTGSEVYVKLFAVPQAIIQKYLNVQSNKPIFNLPSNGWCNKQIKDFCKQIGITRPVTFHAARHTFATTITLAQGMPIETISKLLGHRNIRTTQIYATITHGQLDKEMSKLSSGIDAQFTLANSSYELSDSFGLPNLKMPPHSS